MFSNAILSRSACFYYVRTERQDVICAMFCGCRRNSGELNSSNQMYDSRIFHSKIIASNSGMAILRNFAGLGRAKMLVGEPSQIRLFGTFSYAPYKTDRKNYRRGGAKINEIKDECSGGPIQEFLGVARKYTKLSEPTPEMPRELMERGGGPRPMQV